MVENLDYSAIDNEGDEEAKALHLLERALSGVLEKSWESIHEEVHGSLPNALLLCATHSDKIRVVRKTPEMDDETLMHKIRERYAEGAQTVVILVLS